MHTAVSLVFAADHAESRIVLSFLEGHRITFSPIRIERPSALKVTRAVPHSVYHKLPILVHGEKTVEDWRAIILYVDEVLLSGKLASSLSPTQSTEFWEALELIASGHIEKIGAIKSAFRSNPTASLLLSALS